MGILERLGTVLKSYISDIDDKTHWRNEQRFFKRSDPDLDNAFDELNDFLNGAGGAGSTRGTESAGEKKRPVPEHVRKDFEELGLTPDATAEECKDAYKKLLKIHHPDHHANHDANMKKATEKTTRVNAAYERLTEWYKGANQ